VKKSPLEVAADNADWQQVAMVHQYGPPCFHLDRKLKKFCLRAKPWFGHFQEGSLEPDHEFVSLAELLRRNVLPFVVDESKIRRDESETF
jgi:hypothetical protein